MTVGAFEHLGFAVANQHAFGLQMDAVIKVQLPRVNLIFAPQLELRMSARERTDALEFSQCVGAHAGAKIAMTIDALIVAHAREDFFAAVFPVAGSATWLAALLVIVRRPVVALHAGRIGHGVDFLGEAEHEPFSGLEALRMTLAAVSIKESVRR
jgi:hypothetical protein